MNRRKFKDLIRRYLSGEASPDEIRLVESWMAHRRKGDPFSDLSTEERERIRLRMLTGISHRLKGRGRDARGKTVWFRSAALYRSAAAVLICAALIYAFTGIMSRSISEGSDVVEVHSSEGEVRKVLLNDGSIVWLKGDSRISYPDQFPDGERNVTLAGEALFEVAKDPGRPFVIQCGRLRAQVLGTSFNIKAGEEQIEVLVLTGKVALTSEGNNRGIVVLPNERAVFQQNANLTEKIKVSAEETLEKTRGTEYSMRFHAAPMSEIIRRIEGKFDVRVLVDDQRLNNCKITADFTDQSLDRTLNMISQILGFNYTIDGNVVSISGTSCNP